MPPDPALNCAIYIRKSRGKEIAETTEREGSRLEVYLFGVVKVFHRPHPSPDTDKGAVSAVRKWLEENGVTP